MIKTTLWIVASIFTFAAGFLWMVYPLFFVGWIVVVILICTCFYFKEVGYGRQML